MKKDMILVVLGPTASGKSDLAVEIAQKFNGEVISADSRQIYKELNLASGKITEKEMKCIPHYMIDVISLKGKKIYSAELFKKQASRKISEILTAKKLPIICGGTAFYINALISDHKFPKVGPNQKLREILEKLSTNDLFAQLQNLDPERAQNIDPKNRHRLMRSIEIATAIGKVPPIQKKEKYDVLKIGINWPKEELEKRIKKRLEKRLRLGMIEEIKQIYASGIKFKKMEELGLEPKYIALYLQGKISKEEMKGEIIKESLRYAKRQMTWFKKDRDIHWINNKRQAFKLTDDFLN